MNQEWQNFLIQQGAQFQDGAQIQDHIVQDFGNLQAELAAARDGTILSDLSQFGVIRVAGEDAQKFLQSLLSNDINSVNSKTSQLSSFSNPKGRMLATFLIWQQGSDYMLQLPRSLTAAMQKKLSMYVMRAKVKVSDASDEIVSLGIAGSKTSELINQYFNITLDQNNAVAQHNDTSVIRIAAQRYQINTSPQQAISMWKIIASSAKVAGSSCWDWLNIRAGIPVVTPATQEQFVLQMTNLDLLDGVSFKKGCYPGQEIVARTHYLGKQKKRMFLAHVDAEKVPAAGNEVFSEVMAGQPCGMVINACAAPGGGYDLLAVMQISSRESNKVNLDSLLGAKLNFLPLPYTLPAEAEIKNTAHPS